MGDILQKVSHYTSGSQGRGASLPDCGTSPGGENPPYHVIGFKKKALLKHS